MLGMWSSSRPQHSDGLLPANASFALGQKILQWGRNSLWLMLGLSFRLPIAFDLLILKQRWKSFLNWCVVSLILFLVSPCKSTKGWIGLAIERAGSINKIT